MFERFKERMIKPFMKDNNEKIALLMEELKKEYEWYLVTESEEQKHRHIEAIRNITVEISDLADEIVILDNVFGFRGNKNELCR